MELGFEPRSVWAAVSFVIVMVQRVITWGVISHEYGLWAILVCNEPGCVQETDQGGSDQLGMFHLPKGMTEKSKEEWVLKRDVGWWQRQCTANSHWALASSQALGQPLRSQQWS